MKRSVTMIKKMFTGLTAAFVMLAGCSLTAYATEGEAQGVAAVVEVESYSIEEGFLQAGSNVTIDFVLHNTSALAAANSLIMTVSSESNMIYPSFGSDNQIYVGSIKAGESQQVSVKVTVSPELTADMTDLTCRLDYVSAGRQMSNTSRMVIPTTGARTIGVRSVEVSPVAKVDGKTLISLSLVNNGNANITDAELVIEGNVSDESKNIPLDTIYFGKTHSEDCQITFTESGEQSVNVSLGYTNTEGEKEKIELGVFTVTVEEDAAEITEKGSNAALGTIGKVITFLSLFAAAAVTVGYIIKR
ncbi:MAG: hypothetical protein K6G10_04140 [Butyrivibrio sp.]|nr:hypothetical protein [Butyrivibrio sp.]